MIERFFYILTRSFPEACFLISQDEGILAVNPSGEQMLGADIEMLSGTKLEDIIADPHEKLSRYLKACFRSSEPVPGALRWRTPEGQTIDCRCKGNLIIPDAKEEKRFILLRCEPKKTESNRFIVLNKTLDELRISYHKLILGAEALKKEIAERITAEMKVKESQERLATILDSLDASVYVADMKTYEIIFVNKYARDVFGAVEGKVCWQALQAGQTGPCDFCTNKKIVDSDGNPATAYTWEFQNTKTNKWYYIIDRAIRWVDGRIVRLEIATDITESKRSEIALLESQRFIQNILETVEEVFIVIDRDYKILAANNAYLKHIGMPIEAAIGKYCYEMSHHCQKPCYELGEDCTVNHVFETGKPHECLHTHYSKEGNPIYVETKAYPMKDASGKVISVIEIMNDVTEKKKLENQLRQSQKMESIGLLAGGIAHDFNNILTAIIGYGNMLAMKLKHEDPLRAYVEPILAAADKAAALTQSLLVFSRKQVSNPRSVNLNEIIKNIENFLGRVIGEDVELKVILSDKELIAMADPGQIEQILMNLATNARDAMPEGGILTIETDVLEMDAQYVRRHGYGRIGRYGVITVSDSGGGMDEKTRLKIFEPFFTTKEVGKGTGLGLAIVYGIVKTHNGYINCYSEIGKGTSFKIYLPLIEAKIGEVRDALSGVVAKVCGGTETILVAEDEEQVRKFTGELLISFGYKVIEAVDGEDAVDKFIENKEKIKLVILDVIMPKMNGREVYERIKKINPDIKAIFASGYPADFIQKKDILETGVTFITKPVPPTLLLSKVREVLDKK